MGVDAWSIHLQLSHRLGVEHATAWLLHRRCSDWTDSTPPRDAPSDVQRLVSGHDKLAPGERSKSCNRSDGGWDCLEAIAVGWWSLVSLGDSSSTVSHARCAGVLSCWKGEEITRQLLDGRQKVLGQQTHHGSRRRWSWRLARWIWGSGATKGWYTNCTPWQILRSVSVYSIICQLTTYAPCWSRLVHMPACHLACWWVEQRWRAFHLWSQMETNNRCRISSSAAGLARDTRTCDLVCISQFLRSFLLKSIAGAGSLWMMRWTGWPVWMFVSHAICLTVLWVHRICLPGSAQKLFHISNVCICFASNPTSTTAMPLLSRSTSIDPELSVDTGHLMTPISVWKVDSNLCTLYPLSCLKTLIQNAFVLRKHHFQMTQINNALWRNNFGGNNYRLNTSRLRGSMCTVWDSQVTTAPVLRALARTHHMYV